MKRKIRCRIVKRTDVDGHITYVIQQKHLLFRWWWVDAWVNSVSGATCIDNFGSFEEAKKNLCYFDGSTNTDEVVKVV